MPLGVVIEYPLKREVERGCSDLTWSNSRLQLFSA